MAPELYPDDDPRVLPPDMFDFVLNNELKRALRSQNFLTLLLVDPTPQEPGAERAQLAREIARVISREVRETDLLSPSEEGRLSLVLLDADLPNSMRVVERLMTRFGEYEFSTPATISIGAACCPTHGADAVSLRRAAESQPLDTRRDQRGSARNTQ